jgi:hypothetical protein
MSPRRGPTPRLTDWLTDWLTVSRNVTLTLTLTLTWERGLLNAGQFGFRARHSTILQCMRLTDHVTPNFNNKMSRAAVFLDIVEAFDTTWHSGLLCKLLKLEFSTSLIKLISSFLSQCKFSVSEEGEMSTPREMQAGVPQTSVLSPTLHNMYIRDDPQIYGVHLALFPDDTCLYATDCKEGFVVRKLQRDRLQGGFCC